VQAGLARIIRDGGQVYSAIRRYKWPGIAAVIVSQIHVSKLCNVQQVFLNDKAVQRISAYLVSGDMDESPSRLLSSPHFSAGSKIYGQGFLFDDLDLQATPLIRMPGSFSFPI
jgi:hypothetical protein